MENVLRNTAAAFVIIAVIIFGVVVSIDYLGTSKKETVVIQQAESVIPGETAAQIPASIRAGSSEESNNWAVEFGKLAGDQIAEWHTEIDRNRLGYGNRKLGLESFEAPEALSDIAAASIFSVFKKEMVDKEILDGAMQYMLKYRRGYVNSPHDPSLEEMDMRIDPRLREAVGESADKLEEELMKFYYDLRQKKYDKPGADKIAAFEGLEAELSDHFKQDAL